VALCVFKLLEQRVQSEFEAVVTMPSSRF